MRTTRLAACLLLAFPAGALASGYHVGTQSPSNQGVANAGAAGVFDASTIFFNPAGLTRLKGTRFTAVAAYAMPSADFTPGASTIMAPVPSGPDSPTTDIPLTGNDGGTFVDNAVVPHLYFSSQINDSLTFGVGAFVPFGSKTRYDEEWVGRYNIVSSELVTLAINPSVGYKVSDKLSLGAGVSSQYMSGKLGRHVNFGAAGLRVVPLLQVAGDPTATANLQQAATGALLGMYGNSAYDGTVAIEGEDWAWGYNLGALWELSDRTRIGVAYRSPVRHTLSGTADWTTSNIASGISGALTPLVGATTAGALGAGAQANLDTTYVDSGATVKVETPESWSINGWHALSDSWAIMADLTWTGHSRFKELRVDFASSVPDSITVEDWTDTTRWSVGTTWRQSDALTWRAGLAIDYSPVDDENRTASIPDNTRYWYSAGFSYTWSPKTVFDFVYTFVDVKGSTISHYDDGGGELPCACSYATLRGEYKLTSHLLGFQLNHTF